MPSYVIKVYIYIYIYIYIYKLSLLMQFLCVGYYKDEYEYWDELHCNYYAMDALMFVRIITCKMYYIKSSNQSFKCYKKNFFWCIFGTQETPGTLSSP